MNSQDDSELLGAHDQSLPIKSSGARATVRLDTGVRRKVSESLAAASETVLPDHVYLCLENVRGTRGTHKLSVYVNELLAGSVALFGLRRASLKDGQHGGEGLNFVLDMTHVIDTLHLDDALELDSLDVRIVPSHAVADNEDFSVGRVSVTVRVTGDGKRQCSCAGKYAGAAHLRGSMDDVPGSPRDPRSSSGG